MAVKPKDTVRLWLTVPRQLHVAVLATALDNGNGKTSSWDINKAYLRILALGVAAAKGIDMRNVDAVIRAIAEYDCPDPIIEAV